jgi:hypothetical protein
MRTGAPGEIVATEGALVPLDTDRASHELQVDLYRRLGGTDRAAIMFRLSDFARRVSLAGIRHRHPEYDDELSLLALARLRFGDDLVGRAWPGRPLVEP